MSGPEDISESLVLDKKTSWNENTEAYSVFEKLHRFCRSGMSHLSVSSTQVTNTPYASRDGVNFMAV